MARFDDPLRLPLVHELDQAIDEREAGLAAWTARTTLNLPDIDLRSFKLDSKLRKRIVFGTVDVESFLVLVGDDLASALNCVATARLNQMDIDRNWEKLKSEAERIKRRKRSYTSICMDMVCVVKRGLVLELINPTCTCDSLCEKHP